jgi:hypothetical protein
MLFVAESRLSHSGEFKHKLVRFKFCVSVKNDLIYLLNKKKLKIHLVVMCLESTNLWATLISGIYLLIDPEAQDHVQTQANWNKQSKDRITIITKFTEYIGFTDAFNVIMVLLLNVAAHNVNVTGRVCYLT